MNLSGLAQFIFGFLIGVFILTGAGAATAYWFFTRMSDTPPQPNFAEEPSSSETSSKQKQSQKEKPSQSNNQQQQSAATQEKSSTQASSTTSKQSEKSQSKPSQPESTSEPTIKERFGQQAYKAQVTWPEGLSLRNRPSLNSSRVGGVYYNDQLVILEKSSDGDWQKVYVPETGEKAWVKAGNVEKIN